PAVSRVDPLRDAPMRTLRLGVPPIFRKPVKPPVRGPELQLSHVTLAEPYPNPKLIQKPSRRCGYCACAVAAVQESTASSATNRVVVSIKPSLPMIPATRETAGAGSGEIRAGNGEPGRRVGCPRAWSVAHAKRVSRGC